MIGTAAARTFWVFVGAPGTYALSNYVVAPVFDLYPKWLLVALLAVLVICIWTGTKALFRLLTCGTGAKLALCFVYSIIAYFALLFVGAMAWIARVGLCC